MSAIRVAGCSAAGKSTVAALLARWGLASIVTDDDPLLARFVDPAGAVVRGDTREYLRRKLPPLPDSLRASGAITIDARQPPNQVVDAIVSRTLPMTPDCSRR